MHTALWLKDPADPQWGSELQACRDDIAKYGAGAALDDVSTGLPIAPRVSRTAV